MINHKFVVNYETYFMTFLKPRFYIYVVLELAIGPIALLFKIQVYGHQIPVEVKLGKWK